MSGVFRGLRDPSRPAVHYFANPKSRVKSDVMQTVLTRLNKKLLFEQRKVIQFLEYMSHRIYDRVVFTN